MTGSHIENTRACETGRKKGKIGELSRSDQIAQKILNQRTRQLKSFGIEIPSHREIMVSGPIDGWQRLIKKIFSIFF